MNNPESKIGDSNIVSEQEAYKVILDLLAQFNTVDNQDVQNLRDAIREPRCLEAFDKLSDEKKMTIALLHKLPEDELRAAYDVLKNAQNVSKLHYLGFHRLNAAFQFLILNIKDQKYDFIKDKKKE